MRLMIAVLLCLPVLDQSPQPDSPKPQPKQEAAELGQPADRKAFDDARALKEPDKRTAALEQFLKDYPSSSSAFSARRELVSLWVKSDPAGAEKRVDAIAAPLRPLDAAPLYRSLATGLHTAKQQPEVAERAARKALDLFKYSDFAAEAKSGSEKRNLTPPVEAQLRARYKTQRAQMNETLAQILEAKGQNDRARKLYSSALKASPALGSSAQSLAALAEKSGKPSEALAYYAQWMLARPSPDSRKAFYSAWEKSKGSAESAEAYLDHLYEKIFPNPIVTKPYRPAAGRSNRVALAEIYTGAGCGPCVAADLAFDSVLERYSRSDVAVLMYHEHIPRPDPMTNSDTLARWNWQQGRGVPTYAVDGEVSNRGGGNRDYAPEIEALVREMIEKQLASPASADLKLSARHDGSAVHASATVSSIAKPSPDLMLNLALVEKEIRYSGENGVRFHSMVVRSLTSFPLKEAKEKSESHTFDLSAVAAALKRHLDEFEKHDERYNKDGKFRFMARLETINPEELAVVAFVQDSKTKEVLQAAFADAPKR